MVNVTFVKRSRDGSLSDPKDIHSHLVMPSVPRQGDILDIPAESEGPEWTQTKQFGGVVRFVYWTGRSSATVEYGNA